MVATVQKLGVMSLPYLNPDSDRRQLLPVGRPLPFSFFYHFFFFPQPDSPVPAVRSPPPPPFPLVCFFPSLRHLHSD